MSSARCLFVLHAAPQEQEPPKQQFVYATQGRGLYAMDDSNGQYVTVCGSAVGVVLIEKAGELSMLVYDAQRKPLVTGPLPPTSPLQPHAANAYANFKAMGRQYSLAMPAPAATLSLLSASFALQCHQLVHGGAAALAAAEDEVGKGGANCEMRWMHLIQSKPSTVLVQSAHAAAAAGSGVHGHAALYSVLSDPAQAKDATAAANTMWTGPLPADASIGGSDSSMFAAPLQHLLSGMAPGETRAFLLPQRVAHAALHTPQSSQVAETDIWDLPSQSQSQALPGGTPWAVLHLTVASCTSPAPAAAAPGPAPASAPSTANTQQTEPPSAASTPPNDEEARRNALADRMAKLSAAGTGRPVMMIGRSRAVSSASQGDAQHAVDHTPAAQHSAPTPASVAPREVASPAAQAASDASAAAKHTDANTKAEQQASQAAAAAGLSAATLPSTNTELVPVQSDDEEQSPGVPVPTKGVSAPAPAPAPVAGGHVAYAVPQAAPLSNAVLERVLTDTGRLLVKVDDIQDSIRAMAGAGNSASRRRQGAAHASESSSDSQDSRRRRKRSSRKSKKSRSRRSGGSSESDEEIAAGELLSSLSAVLGKSKQYQERISTLESKVRDLRSSLKAARAEVETAHEAQDELRDELAAAKRGAAAAKRAEAQSEDVEALKADLLDNQETITALRAQLSALQATQQDAAAAQAAAAADAGSAELAEASAADLVQQLCKERTHGAEQASSVRQLQDELSAAQKQVRELQAAAESQTPPEQDSSQAAEMETLKKAASDAEAKAAAAADEIAELKQQLAAATAAADARVSDAVAAGDAKLAAMKAAFKQEALAAIARAKEEGIALGKQQAAAE